MPNNDRLSPDNKKARQVEQIIDILFSGDSVSREELDEIRGWLTEEANGELKNEALQKKFIETYNYNSRPSYAPQMWPDLARRLGIDPGVAKGRRTATKVPLRRRMAFRVAAVLIPAFIVGAALGVLVYRTVDKGAPMVADVVTVSVPDGQKKTMTLPDGSQVRMAPGTTLAYAGNFAEGRQVTLDGEAYFTVERDVQHPFTVSSGDTKVTVLGTEFNMKAYPDMPTLEVVLASGEVQVEAGESIMLLQPSQKATVDRGNNEMRLDRVSEGELMRLRGEALVFRGQTLDEAIRLTGQYFGRTMNVGAGIDLSGEVVVEFDGDATIEDVMRLLKITTPVFEYTIDGDTVHIRKN